MSKAYNFIKLFILPFVFPLFTFAADLLDANTFFSSDSELEKFVCEKSEYCGSLSSIQIEKTSNNIWRFQFQVLRGEVTEDGERFSEKVAVLFDYDYDSDSIVGGTGNIAGIEFCKGHAYLDRLDHGCYSKPKLSPKQLLQTKIIVHYLIKKRIYENLTNYIYNRAMSKHKNHDLAGAASEALEVIDDKYWAFIPISEETIIYYNDFAFFLQNGGKNAEAAGLLEMIISKFPDRTVAYINLGDAYYGLKEFDKAASAYQTYISLMKKSGKEKAIPKRVIERSNTTGTQKP